MDFSTTKSRLQAHLRECSRRYPTVWRDIDLVRSKREELGDWPGWCFCPLAGAYAIISRGSARRLSPDESVDIGRIGALASWRVSQGIYLVDSTILDAVIDTPMAGNLPVDVLLSLPEWCCYVRTPGYFVEEHEIHGFFVHLEHDQNDGRTELRIQLDLANEQPFDSLVPEIIHLTAGGTFDDGYRAMLAEMRRNFERRRRAFVPDRR